MNKLKKGALFTDIHIGAKMNSIQHNEDCMNYIEWFIDIVKSDKSIDYICFLGDWHESRNSINVSTLNYSYMIAKKLNDLNMPVFFIVGNHDLYYRNNRSVHSTIQFNEFSNFVLIEEPTLIDDVENGMLVCPYIFHDEYGDLAKYNNTPIWVGHFEFKDFVVTGYNITLKTGPDHKAFKNQKHIISGHFHKRQMNGNVTYIGNTFPTNFSDAGDNDRGMAILDNVNMTLNFKNWDDCPKYISCKLSDISSKKVKIHDNSRVICTADVPITYDESLELKRTLKEQYNLREFDLRESTEIQEALTETEGFDGDMELESVDNMVVSMLRNIESDHIDTDLLENIYIDLDNEGEK